MQVPVQALDFSADDLAELVPLLAQTALFSSLPTARGSSSIELLVTSIRARSLRALSKLLQQPAATALFLNTGTLLKQLASLSTQADSSISTTLLEGSAVEALSGLSSYEMELSVRSDVAAKTGAAKRSLWRMKDSKAELFASFDGRNVLQFSSSDKHGLACCDDGSLWAWGSNKAGQLGRPRSLLQSSTDPILVLEGAGISHVCAGDMHSVAISIDGSVFSFGLNESGQLGVRSSRDDSNTSEVPRLARLPAGCVAVQAALGSQHTLLLMSDGSIYGCGDNQSFQLGSATSPSRFATQLRFRSSLVSPKFVFVAAVNEWSFAVTEEGQIMHWGTGVGELTSVRGISKSERITQLRVTSKQVAALSSSGKVFSCDLVKAPKSANASGYAVPCLQFSVVAGLKDIVLLGISSNSFVASDKSSALFQIVSTESGPSGDFLRKLTDAAKQLPCSPKMPLFLTASNDANVGVSRPAVSEDERSLLLVPTHFYPMDRILKFRDVFGGEALRFSHVEKAPLHITTICGYIKAASGGCVSLRVREFPRDNKILTVIGASNDVLVQVLSCCYYYYFYSN
jgi:alpha-tubulin suppressor-like RCC1 family protein